MFSGFLHTLAFLADLVEAKQGSTLPQTSDPIDLSTAKVPLSLSWEQATVRFWPATFTVSEDNSLQCAHTAEAMTRRRSIFYFATSHTRRHVHLPTTSTQPILDAWGPFWSQSGPWHAPPPDREWETDRELESWQLITALVNEHASLNKFKHGT